MVTDMTNGRQKLLELAVKEARESHGWMLASIKHASDETSGGNYSDELKNSIVVQALLDLTEDLEARLPDA